LTRTGRAKKKRGIREERGRQEKQRERQTRLGGDADDRLRGYRHTERGT
jgi:hypothetical protein